MTQTAYRLTSANTSAGFFAAADAAIVDYLQNKGPGRTVLSTIGTTFRAHSYAPFPYQDSGTGLFVHVGTHGVPNFREGGSSAHLDCLTNIWVLYADADPENAASIVAQASNAIADSLWQTLDSAWGGDWVAFYANYGLPKLSGPVPIEVNNEGQSLLVRTLVAMSWLHEDS